MTNTFDYQAEAQLTKSNQFHGELVSMDYLKLLLASTIENLQQLDRVKKALFYGKENKTVSPDDYDQTCRNLNDINGLSISKGTDVVHSIIGKATEAGELLEALFKTIVNDTPFDVTNFREEIGDGFWYDAIGLNAIGSSFQEAQTINIAKLRARFPNKFTEFDANNRNLAVERKILENGE